MAKQYQMRSPGICLSGSKPPTLPDLSIPASHCPNWHIRTNMHTPSTTVTPKFEWPSSTEPVRSVSASRSQKRPIPVRSQQPGLPPPLHTYSNQPIYFLSEPRHVFSMDKQYRVRSLRICLSGSQPPPPRSLHLCFPPPPSTYQIRLICSLCNPRPAIPVARQLPTASARH